MPEGRSPRVPRYVILLRGVMPSGKNRVLMAPLREALEAAGLAEVRTYIQSGNVVATSPLARADVEQLVHDVIARTQGGDLTVLARTASAFRKVVERNPFSDAEGTRAYTTLLAEKPDPALADAFRATDFAPEDVRLEGDVVYTLYATKLSDSKFHNATHERMLKVRATTRNLNTMRRLVDMVE